MNTLVTGGTGFIGTALVRRLLKNNNSVIILTRDKNKVDKSFKGKIEILEGDICNLASLESLKLEQNQIDIFVHLAASLNYFGDKKRLFKVNVEGTINLLKFAKKNKIKKFIFTSSIESIGTIKKEDIPADENYICQPISPYGESKLEAEKQIFHFGQKESPNKIVLRLGNVYGPGSPAFIVPIANAILMKDRLLKFLPVYKDRYLHPIYIEDVVEGIVKAAQKSDICGTYIIAGKEYVTIGRLFYLINRVLNGDIDLQIKKRNIKDELYLNLRKKIQRFQKEVDLLTYFIAGEGEKIHRAYSIEKAKKVLDYFPKVSLKEGIAKAIEWAKKEGLLTK